MQRAENPFMFGIVLIKVGSALKGLIEEDFMKAVILGDQIALDDDVSIGFAVL